MSRNCVLLLLCILIFFVQVYGKSNTTEEKSFEQSEPSFPTANEIVEEYIQTSNANGTLRIRRSIIADTSNTVKSITDKLKWIKNNFRYMFLMFAAVITLAVSCTLYRRCIKDTPSNFGDDGMQVVIVNRPQEQHTQSLPSPSSPLHTPLKPPSRPPPPKRSKPTRPSQLKQLAKGPGKKGMKKSQGKTRAGDGRTSNTQRGSQGNRCNGSGRDALCDNDSKRPLLMDDGEANEIENLDKGEVKESIIQVPSLCIKAPFSGRQTDTQNLRDVEHVPRDIHQIERCKSTDGCYFDPRSTQGFMNQHDPPGNREMCPLEQDKHKDESELDISNTHALSQLAPRVLQEELDTQGTRNIYQLEQPKTQNESNHYPTPTSTTSQHEESQLDIRNTHDVRQLAPRVLKLETRGTWSIYQLEKPKTQKESNLEPMTTSTTSQHDPRIIHDAIPLSCFMSYQQLADASAHGSYLAQYIDEMRAHAAQLHAEDDAIVTNTCVDACSIAGILLKNDGLDKSLRERQEHYYPLASTDTYLPITATVK